MLSELKPIYLFADSQLLFWRTDEAPFLLSVRKLIETETPKAAYLGASNDDNPIYFEIFESAMENIGIENRRLISSQCSTEEVSFVEQADLILLAGGDVEKGWSTFERNGLKDLIVTRHFEGALLMGVSAGAVQLGMLGWPESDIRAATLFHTFRLVPFIIGAHDEKNDWRTLKTVLQTTEINVSGIGIPSGGGMIYHADHTVEPIRHPLHEFSVEQGELKHTLLYASS